MCVKEFYGYNCGHCSVPILRRCPLSASNPIYPPCKLPAERPIFTNGFCHPCSRIVWNNQVLKDEEEHRARHLAGECMCEVIFEGEDREKHHRTRSGKGKSRAKGKESTKGGQGGYGMGDGESGGYDMGEGGVGGFAGHIVEGDPGGFGGHALAVAEPGGYGDDRRDIEEHFIMPNEVIEVEDIQGWEAETEDAGYEYAGYYYTGDGQSQGSQATEPGPSYDMTLAPYEHQGAQLPMGQRGAGMKWYPNYENFPALPPALPTAIVHQANIENAPRGPQAMSAPVGKYDKPGPSEQVKSPVVVSSDMTSS